ncbi:hypothetical protein HMPREF0183_1718 [Brevibacterium mcbrellneri ATCC 49030]|uniref:Lipoprotein n=1 Tax=Brevibacterium mcbrellneri ATCC 49030 TaxID=585530 RepID=D4YP58_9MICO|nr:hypothetical protein [Brevibacterium mcbrellneri]EFG47015.1 hypothetical protein HMPREF0183_1718 [Brevibacterium mcbrellneri ATCC 49030]
MKKLVASVCVVGLVAAGLSGCSWFDRSGVVVSEDEFRITEDTLFATQLSPIYQEMDTAPGINTSYLVTFDRDGSVQALKIHPMAIGVPIWQGDTLVAVDRKFDYFVTDKVLMIDHPKTEVMTNIVASSTTDEVFALMNDGATEDGYRSVTETITPQGYTTTNLDGAYLMTSECDGVLYGIGDAEGRVAAQASKELGDHVTALVQASGTANHQEHVISYTKGLFNEGGSSPLPCFSDSIVNLILDEAPLGQPEPLTGYLRVRNVREGSYKDVPLRQPDGNKLEHKFDGPYYDRVGVAGRNFNWLDRDGSFFRTNVDTGVTEKLFQIQESEQFFAVGNVAFSPEGIHIIAELEEGTVIKSFSKEDGSLIRTLEVPGFDTITARTRQHWGLAVSPNVP